MVLVLQSCHYPPQSDSRHYGVNYNFICTGDSLGLQVSRPLHNQPVDTFQYEHTAVYEDEEMVVAAFAVIPEDTIDSVWVKVARDQQTQGWVHERELLAHVVPNDPISQFIHFFSQRHSVVFLSFVTFIVVVQILWVGRKRTLHTPHWNDIASFYPTSVLLLFLLATVLYGTIQKHAPDIWESFYYHPSLNPFGQPLLLGLFLGTVWTSLICMIAAIDDIFALLWPLEATLYVVSLMGQCMVGYILINLASRCGMEYPLVMLYAVWAVMRYVRRFAPHCRCGACGAKMHAPGVCMRCGARNT